MGGRQHLTIAFCSLVLIAALIALPSTAKAWHYSLNGWDFDSYAECMDYHTKNPPTAGCSINPTICHPAYTPQFMCASKKAEEDEKRREQAKTYRIIVLSCRADSVSEEQFAACVALATGH
jgi:hypothetical protein